MFKSVIKEALHHISHDVKLIRLSFLTSFSHSFIVVLLLVYNINNILIARFDKGIEPGVALSFFMDWINQHSLVVVFIVVLIVLIIGYSIIYPIGQAALIHYLDGEETSISRSIGQGATNFFTMFEFDALALSFGSMTFIITILRLFMLDILDNVIMKVLLSMRGLCVLVATILWPYVKYAIVLEGKNLNEAIKRSIQLSARYLGVTIRFVFLELFLLIRFFINVLVILGVPFLIVYIANFLHILNPAVIGTIIAIVGVTLVVITLYINAIIEAFFSTYWYKIYEKIKE